MLLERHEGDVGLGEGVEDGDDLPQRPTEPGEFADDHPVAALEEVQQLVEPAALVGSLSRGGRLDERVDADVVLACIVYGQAREISRLAAAPDFPFDPDLLRHVSPIEWKNVILYGAITIDPAKLTMRDPSRVFLHESCREPCSPISRR